ncbi:MAG: hypothetical protein COV59_01725 [Candidatus Magasanikbacteria bacterium CG11_big_fil_rev_8_21_14_0_20_39_34]|uniref:Uncharacterized protein n=1 Tax=Candidatus Magasanikbacteria bacterium CG11_big_fil_rev_8_21_14_0_20_39_34 TaxID=1974653 RepID=A0A2H0N880_9BACT|nr:MAG: hypothetical protein COV59_01725 [Candidatus Magasanikbacteria bacterium CG11_big_fil_rev_8_21_14_0_20_39_34]
MRGLFFFEKFVKVETRLRIGSGVIQGWSNVSAKLPIIRQPSPEQRGAPVQIRGSDCTDAWERKDWAHRRVCGEMDVGKPPPPRAISPMY